MPHVLIELLELAAAASSSLEAGHLDAPLLDLVLPPSSNCDSSVATDTSKEQFKFGANVRN